MVIHLRLYVVASTIKVHLPKFMHLLVISKVGNRI